MGSTLEPAPWAAGERARFRRYARCRSAETLEWDDLARETDDLRTITVEVGDKRGRTVQSRGDKAAHRIPKEKRGPPPL
jgi:hypothetical protein